jgi:hypothetical protein
LELPAGDHRTNPLTTGVERLDHLHGDGEERGKNALLHPERLERPAQALRDGGDVQP